MISASTIAAVPLLASASPASAATGTVSTSPADSSENVITPQSAAVLPLTVQAAPNQTSNLQSWNGSDGSTLTAVAANGRIERPATGTGHGPFAWEVGGQYFLAGAPKGSDGSGGAIFDPVSYIGYNDSNHGHAINPDEPVTAWVLEGDYDNGSIRTMEHYLEARSINQTVSMRPLFFQTKRDATTPEGFLTLAEVWGNPFVIKTPQNDSSNYLSPGGAMVEFRKNETFFYSTRSDADNVLHVRAPSGHNSKIMLGANGVSDSYRIETSLAGRMDFAVAGQEVLRLYGFPGGGGGIAVGGANDNSATGLFAVSPNTGQRAVVARGRQGQTQPILEIQDGGAVQLGGFDKGGFFFTKKTSAPSDSDVANGQLFLWFDQTPGKPKLVVKARDSGGTIRTGSVALS
ncbi:MAG: hypothetical protein QOJ12_408 [Thermoleophilales bacterium]|nr:hypothetical protein [Thermoleophilales bacterium]